MVVPIPGAQAHDVYKSQTPSPSSTSTPLSSRFFAPNWLGPNNSPKEEDKAGTAVALNILAPQQIESFDEFGSRRRFRTRTRVPARRSDLETGPVKPPGSPSKGFPQKRGAPKWGSIQICRSHDAKPVFRSWKAWALTPGSAKRIRFLCLFGGCSTK